VRSSCYEVAHRLAKDGCVNVLRKTWLGLPPGVHCEQLNIRV
jgi:hypothetical protein